MKSWSILTILVVASILMGAVPASANRVITRGGVQYDCAPLARSPGIFQCWKKGDITRTIVFLTGDTESGCHPGTRLPYSQCYELDTTQIEWADGSGVERPPLRRDNFVVVSCDDGLEEGDIDWLDELIEALENE